MEHIDFVPRYLTGPGVEIGAFKNPIPGIDPIYVDRYQDYANEPTLASYYGDACELPFLDSSLQYVATSHVLEHVANPLAGLCEWFRVIRHGGYIYMVLPDRKKTWDHPRKLTEVSHMLEDYRNTTTQFDGIHIDEFVYGVDWKMYSPATDPSEETKARDELAAIYHRSMELGEEFNIHYHTFESQSAVELIDVGNRESIWPGKIEVIETVEDFPYPEQLGFLIVARVEKNLGSRFKTLLSKKGLKADARAF